MTKISALIALTLFLPMTLLSERSSFANADSVLSAHAAAEFNKGLVAVEQKEWDIAVRYFYAARDIHFKDSPLIFFNLAVAHERAGRELESIAWFLEYLRAAPKADNADAVWNAVQRLHVITETKIVKILREAWAAAERTRLEARDRRQAVFAVASAWAASGDLVGALKLPSSAAVRSCCSDVESLRNVIFKSHAEALAQAGDSQRAARSAAELREGEDLTWMRVGFALLEDGRYDEAAQAAAKMTRSQEFREQLLKEVDRARRGETSQKLPLFEGSSYDPRENYKFTRLGRFDSEIGGSVLSINVGNRVAAALAGNPEDVAVKLAEIAADLGSKAAFLKRQEKRLRR